MKEIWNTVRQFAIDSWAGSGNPERLSAAVFAVGAVVTLLSLNITSAILMLTFGGLILRKGYWRADSGRWQNKARDEEYAKLDLLARSF
ncbi:hypothetical protein ACFRAQ_34745 [Nocardia sp. NPDC056611]|uniref:hypothetical protein n=1 Tax=Nocardia sp. NPDC056611 TaxID=3345877 RepID=UPI0036716C68